MPWFKVDDGLHSHKKTARAGVPAMGLWVLAGAWCSDNLTDGFIPDYMASRLDPEYAEHAARLVAAGLWVVDEVDGDKGWTFHDWHRLQPSREEALAERDRQSVGGRIGNHRRWHLDKGKVDPNCPHCNRVPDRVPDRGSESVPSRPTRPDPTRPDPISSNPLAHPRVDQGTLIEPPASPPPAEVPAKRDHREQQFEQFWSAYPRKIGKKGARGIWDRAIKSTDPSVITAGALAYAKYLRAWNVPDDKIAHPSTWLNAGRWEDEHPPPPGNVVAMNGNAMNGNGGTTRAQQKIDRNLAVVEQLRQERLAQERPQITGGMP